MSNINADQLQNLSGETIFNINGNSIEFPQGYNPPGLVFDTWTTATRPSSPSVGDIGYNSETVTLEVYYGIDPFDGAPLWGTYDGRLTGSTSGTFSFNFDSLGSSNGTTTASPINVWYRRTIFQTVYTAQELEDNGAQSGATFRNLRWNVTGGVNLSNSILGFNLRLFHTTATSGTQLATPIGQKVTVYSDSPSTEFTAAETPGVLELTFGQGSAGGSSDFFEWDGVNNICIESCTSQNQSTYNQSGQLSIFNVSGGSRYNWTDSTGNSCNDTPNFVQNFKPCVEMDYF